MRSFLVTALFAFSLLSGCSNLVKSLFDKPELRGQQISVEKIDFENVQMRVDFDLFNPNSLDLPLQKLKAELRIRDEKLVEQSWTDLPKLKTKEVTRVSLPLKLTWNQLSKVGFHVFSNDSVPYQVKGVVTLSQFDFPFTENGTFKLKRD